MKYAAHRRRELFFSAHQIKYLNNIHRGGNLGAGNARQCFKLLYFKFLFYLGDSTLPSPQLKVEGMESALFVVLG